MQSQGEKFESNFVNHNLIKLTQILLIITVHVYSWKRWATILSCKYLSCTPYTYSREWRHSCDSYSLKHKIAFKTNLSNRDRLLCLYYGENSMLQRIHFLQSLSTISSTYERCRSRQSLPGPSQGPFWTHSNARIMQKWEPPDEVTHIVHVRRISFKSATACLRALGSFHVARTILHVTRIDKAEGLRALPDWPG